MTLGPAYGDGFAGVANYGEDRAVYLTGDDDTDGSVRFILDDSGNIILAQKRVSGVWVAADLQFDADTWLVDDILGEFVLDDSDGNLVFEGQI